MSENDSELTVTEAPAAERETPRNPKFTLARHRLAGSPSCLNCGTPLKGPFCYYCGQPDRNFMRFFPALLRELMEDFLEFDSRFTRTMKPLLFKPGRLTRDYLDGRRFRYTPPLRLYLFSSIAFFLLAALISSNAARETVENLPADGAQLTEEQLGEAREALEDVPPEVREQLNLNLDQVIENAARRDEAARQASEAGSPGPASREWFNIEGIQFNDEPWDAESNPVNLPWMPQRIDDWINGELMDSPAKAEEINRDPGVIIDKAFDILPATVFVLLPIVALLFKFWYLFAKRYYVEHLIFALHNHAFLFVAGLLILLSVLGMRWADANEMAWAGQAFKWSLVAVSVWIPLYLLISLRTVYRQNWFLTLFKYGVIGISYVTLLGFLTVMVAVLSFLLL